MSRIALAVAAVGLVAASQANAGGTTDIAVEDDFFAPDDAENLAFDFNWDPTGDGVTDHKHNVQQNKGFFRSGQPAKSDSLSILLEGAGKYPYHCDVHSGMDGIVRKYIFGGPIVAGDSQVVNWSGDNSSDRHRYDVQYRKNGHAWKDWKRDTAKTNQAFGADGKPVDVNPAATYEIRARTHKKNNLSKRTGWSNKFTVDVSP